MVAGKFYLGRTNMNLDRDLELLLVRLHIKWRGNTATPAEIELLDTLIEQACSNRK